MSEKVFKQITVTGCSTESYEKAIEAALPEITEVAFRVRASHRQDTIQGNTKGNAQPSGTEGANV